MAIASRQSPPEADSSTPSYPSSSAAVFKRLHPAQYLSRFLAQGYRPDGRKSCGWRKVSVNTGSISTADGSALVRMGDTTMVCGIKAEVAAPDMARHDEGFLVPNVDLPALCSPKFRPGPPSDEAQTLSNWLHDLLVSSRTVPPERLCIAPGKAVWALYVDVVCINFDGNAFDAAVLAVMGALRNTRIPRAKYDEETGRTTCSRDETFPLPLGRMPLTASFGIFQSTHLLPDPTSFESPLLPTTLTIALDENDRSSLVRHEGLGGTAGVSGERVIGEAWGMAQERTQTLRKLISDA